MAGEQPSRRTFVRWLAALPVAAAVPHLDGGIANASSELSVKEYEGVIQNMSPESVDDQLLARTLSFMQSMLKEGGEYYRILNAKRTGDMPPRKDDNGRELSAVLKISSVLEQVSKLSVLMNARYLRGGVPDELVPYFDIARVQYASCGATVVRPRDNLSRSGQAYLERSGGDSYCKTVRHVLRDMKDGSVNVTRGDRTIQIPTALFESVPGQDDVVAYKLSPIDCEKLRVNPRIFPEIYQGTTEDLFGAPLVTHSLAVSETSRPITHFSFALPFGDYMKSVLFPRGPVDEWDRAMLQSEVFMLRDPELGKIVEGTKDQNRAQATSGSVVAARIGTAYQTLAPVANMQTDRCRVLCFRISILPRIASSQALVHSVPRVMN